MPLSPNGSYSMWCHHLIFSLSPPFQHMKPPLHLNNTSIHLNQWYQQAYTLYQQAYTLKVIKQLDFQTKINNLDMQTVSVCLVHDTTKSHSNRIILRFQIPIKERFVNTQIKFQTEFFVVSFDSSHSKKKISHLLRFLAHEIRFFWHICRTSTREASHKLEYNNKHVENTDFF